MSPEEGAPQPPEPRREAQRGGLPREQHHGAHKPDHPPRGGEDEQDVREHHERRQQPHHQESIQTDILSQLVETQVGGL